MIVDPEEIRDQRHHQAPQRPHQGPAGTAEPSVLEQTRQMLARERAGDELAEPCRLLATVRGDRRPIGVAELRQAIAEVARDEGLDVDVVRHWLDRALQSEGSNLQAWEQQLRRPRPRLGKGGSA